MVGDAIRYCIDNENNPSNAGSIRVLPMSIQGEGTIGTLTVTALNQSGVNEVTVITVESGTTGPTFAQIYQRTNEIFFQASAAGTFRVEIFNPTNGFQSATVTVEAQNLPVTWTKPLTYSPQGSDIKLGWSVVDQIDVAGYELERDNGEGFFPVASIPYAAGEGEVNYFALQPWTTKGAYYRVKQLDYAGTYDYTNIVFVPGSTASTVLSAFPNPARDFVQVAVPEGVAEVQVLAATGQVMGTYTAIQARSGIDLSKLAAGVYFLRSMDESYSVPQRLVVQR